MAWHWFSSGVMIVTENCWHVCIVLSHLRNKKSQFKLPGMASLEFDDAFGQLYSRHPSMALNNVYLAFFQSE
jgi:hypothetical protein